MKKAEIAKEVYTALAKNKCTVEDSEEILRNVSYAIQSASTVEVNKISDEYFNNYSD